MASPFFDTFLPNLAQSAAQVGPAAIEGDVVGQQLAVDLANKQALTQLHQMQAKLYGQTNPRMEALRWIQANHGKPEAMDSPLGRAMLSAFAGSPQGFKNLGHGYYVNPRTGQIEALPGMGAGSAGAMKNPFQQASLALGYGIDFQHTPDSAQQVLNYMKQYQGETSKEKTAGNLRAQAESPVTLFKNPAAMQGLADTGVNPLQAMPTPEQAKQNIESTTKLKERVAEAQGRGSALGKEAIQTQQEIADLEATALKNVPLTHMTDQLFTQTNPALAATEGAALRAGAATGLNQLSRAYLDERNSQIEFWGRQMLGMKGVFTDRDIPRIEGFFPNFGDTQQLKDYKNKKREMFMQLVMDAKRRGLTGNVPDSALRKQFDALTLDLTSSLGYGAAPQAGPPSGPVNFEAYYKSLTPLQQQALDRITDEWTAGKRSDDEYRSGVLAITGSSPKSNAIADAMIRGRKKK